MAEQFQKSDYVTYGNTGVCLVEDVRPMTFPHQKVACRYYILRPIGNQSETIYVPCENEALVSKLQYALSRKDINKMLLDIKDQEMDWEEDKNTRAEAFRKVLSRGDRREFLQTANCIYRKKQEKAAEGKKLPQADDKVLRIVEKLIAEEFAFSLKMPEADVPGYILAHLEPSQEL